MRYSTGIVTAIDTANVRVRVHFDQYDGMKSWWLSVLAPKTKDDCDYWMPDIGEQVACLFDERAEDGCILGAVYSTADPPPVASPDKWVRRFADGGEIHYDRARHLLALDLSGCEGTLVLKARNIVLKTTEGGFYHVDHHGYATRITHLDGAAFKQESWTTGAIVTAEADAGYSPDEVDVPEEER